MNTSRWKSRLLIAAAVHCCLWGLFIMAWPAVSFGIYGYADPLVNTLPWQGCGFVIFLFGAGYTFAATDPDRHFSLVLMGAVAKACGTAGVVYGYLIGSLVWYSLLWVTVNDLLWIVPFALIVRDAMRNDRRSRPVTVASRSETHGVWFDWMGA
ncbi:MAG: hypothetical protein HUJ26_02655 [Planctomycetaceae bacterium]|nr:hypothetical protein [Planctomycetaceae bacterium]